MRGKHRYAAGLV